MTEMSQLEKTETKFEPVPPPKAKKAKKAKTKKAAKAEKGEKPKVKWASMIRIDNDKLLAALRGEKNAKSVRTISEKFRCTIGTAKNSIFRAAEANPKLKLGIVSKQEGKAGVKSACYFFK